jgi:hypothetical protein
MITRLINSTHRPTSVKNLDSHCVLDHDMISVHCTTESDTHQLTHDHVIFNQVPDHRCYRPGADRTEKWLPYSAEFTMQLMHPVAWIKHKQTDVVYELMGPGGYICGHGHFNNSKLEIKESIYQFKKLYPELNFVFDLDEIKNITNDLPVLAAHMTVDQVEQVHAKIITELESNLKYCFKDVMWNGWFSRLSYLAGTIVLDIPPVRDKDFVKLLPYVLSDKLNHNGDDLVDQVIKQLDIATVEDFELRARAIKKTVSQWMVDTNFNKLINRLLADNAELYQKILSYYITEEIASQLDTLIKKAIQNEVN